MAIYCSAARLRQIERDLHDGAQVRLAALAMTLGEIKENLEQGTDDDRTLAPAGAAHQNAKDTLTEPRDEAARRGSVSLLPRAFIHSRVSSGCGCSVYQVDGPLCQF